RRPMRERGLVSTLDGSCRRSRSSELGSTACEHGPGDRGATVVLVGPVAPPSKPGMEEKHRQLQQQQFGMDERIHCPLPPFRVAFAVRMEPAVVGLPMARLILLD